MNLVKGNYLRLVKVHRRALCAVHQKLLTLENEISLHSYFTQTLLREIFKALNGLSPVFVAELFKSSHIRYSLRSGQKLLLPPANTVTYGTRS